MAAVSKFNHDANALFGGQSRLKERVGLVSFGMAREYLHDLIHNLIIS
jgi:hypothetical protein